MNILLIEDDEIDAHMFVKRIRDSKSSSVEYNVTRVELLAEGIKALQCIDFDIVFVDLGLPDSLGQEGVERLAQVAEIPIVVLTGNDNDELAVRSLQSGAQDYLSKDEATGKVIRRSLRYAIERKQAELGIRIQQERAKCAIEAKEAAEAKAQLADQLERAKTAAENANRAKSDFLANMSHELRTPLHGILSFAQLGMQPGKQPAASSAYFQRIKDSGEILLSLLNDLLDLAKFESEVQALDIKNFIINDRIQSVCSEFEASCQSKHLRLNINLPDAKKSIRGDAHRIDQVIRNLVSNAVRFSPVNSSVNVSAEFHDEIVEVCVADCGPGIPDNEKESVFDKFVQSSKTKSAAGGTGLGLTICREIVERHRGAIFVENRSPTGAVFRFRLPLNLQIENSYQERKNKMVAP